MPRNGSGEENHNWKGGRIIKGGYVWIYSPTHPRALAKSRLNPRRNYVPEHILVAEKALGRPLKSGRCGADGEVVHHIDGDKTNNRNDNLLICTQSYHRWLEGRMADLYKKEHFGPAAMGKLTGLTTT